MIEKSFINTLNILSLKKNVKKIKLFKLIVSKYVILDVKVILIQNIWEKVQTYSGKQGYKKSNWLYNYRTIMILANKF